MAGKGALFAYKVRDNMNECSSASYSSDQKQGGSSASSFFQQNNMKMTNNGK